MMQPGCKTRACDFGRTGICFALGIAALVVSRGKGQSILILQCKNRRLLEGGPRSAME